MTLGLSWGRGVGWALGKVDEFWILHLYNSIQSFVLSGGTSDSYKYCPYPILIPIPYLVEIVLFV